MSSHNSLSVPMAASNWWPTQVWVINCHFAWPQLLYCGHCQLSWPCLSHGTLAWASPCFVTKQVSFVSIVSHNSQLHPGWKLSIILNRPATGVMTSPCFLPLVAFFQAAKFMTWEYLITDFNWHKPTQHWSPAGFSLSLRQPFGCSEELIHALNVLVEEVYLYVFYHRYS